MAGASYALNFLQHENDKRPYSKVQCPNLIIYLHFLPLKFKMHPPKSATSPFTSVFNYTQSHTRDFYKAEAEENRMPTNSTATQTAASSRRPKWHPVQPPPPSPKILNLPRRNRHRRQLKKPTTRKPSSSLPSDPLLDPNQGYYYETKKGKLERLFGEEREFSRSGCSNVPIVLLNSSASAAVSSFSSSLSSGRRDRVEEEEFGGEKWKFQAEILRAECNFLRLEREVALKKLERHKVQMERTLKSAVQTLISVSFFCAILDFFETNVSISAHANA